MDERFLYLPSAAFAMPLVALAYRLGPRCAIVALPAIMALFAVRTFAGTSRGIAILRAPPPTCGRHRAASTYMGFWRTRFSGKTARNIDRAIQEAEASWDVLRSLPLERIFQFTPLSLGVYFG